MRALFIFCILLLFSCKGNVWFDETKYATAVFSYPVNSSDIINDTKEVNIRSLISYLNSSAKIYSWDELKKITIQKISLELVVNESNQASSIDVKTLVGKIDCAGKHEPLTPFTLNQNIPLQAFGFNLPIAVGIDLSSDGVSSLNNIINDPLPFGEHNQYGQFTCGSIKVVLDGKVNPSSTYASLTLNVIVTYNIEYGVCEYMPALKSITGTDDCDD